MSRTTKILAAVLLVVTAALAAVHLVTRDNVPENTILVRQDGKERNVSVSDLQLIRVQGNIINGKGETIEIDSDGTKLSSFAEGGFTTAKVIADDEYSAEVTAEDTEQAFVIVNEDRSFQLVVFGDADSKRAVRNVVRIEFDD